MTIIVDDDEPATKAASPVTLKAVSEMSTNELLGAIADTTDHIAALKDTLGVFKDELFHRHPIPESGEYVINGSELTATITVPEKLSWDSEKLEQMFLAGGTPTYIKKTLSVDKRHYDRLTGYEKDVLADALTIKPGTPSIKIVRRV